jgi:hypothetical protein
MTAEEVERNTLSGSYIFVHEGHRISMTAISSGFQYEPTSTDHSASFAVDSATGLGFNFVIRSPPATHYFKLRGRIAALPRPLYYFHDIVENKVLVLVVEFPPPAAYKSALLPGLVDPIPLLTQYDLIPRQAKRINKGRFNLMELSKTNGQGQFQQQEQGNYRSQTAAPFRHPYGGQQSMSAFGSAPMGMRQDRNFEYMQNSRGGDMRMHQHPGYGGLVQQYQQQDMHGRMVPQQRTENFNRPTFSGIAPATVNLAPAVGYHSGNSSRFAVSDVNVAHRLPAVQVPTMATMRQQLVMTLEQFHPSQAPPRGRR